MTNPELKENFQPDTNMELNNLKAEIANPDPNVESVPDFLTKEYSAKTANSTEIQNLKKANAMWSDWNVVIKDLVEELLDSNYNNTDRSSWKNLWKDFRYVTHIQASLNILGKTCDITGKYDTATKNALKEYIATYKKIPDFQLESDGILPESMRNVIANALISPNEARWKEIISKSGIGRIDNVRISNTTWYPDEWKIKTLLKWWLEY